MRTDSEVVMREVEMKTVIRTDVVVVEIAMRNLVGQVVLMIGPVATSFHRAASFSRYGFRP